MQGPSARYSLTLTDLGLPQGGAPRGWGSGKNGSVANAAEVLRHVESEAVIRSLGENKTRGSFHSALASSVPGSRRELTLTQQNPCT